MDSDLIHANEKIRSIREQIRKTQEVLKSRRTTIIVPGIILLGLISYGLGLLFSNDNAHFQFCSISVLVSIILPFVIANRMVGRNRKQVAQKLVNELSTICEEEGWKPEWVVNALYIHLSQNALFRDVASSLKVIPDKHVQVVSSPGEAAPTAISPGGNRTLSIWRAVIVPWRLGSREEAEDWTVCLTPSTLEFNCVGGKTQAQDAVTHFSLARNEANVRMGLRNVIADIFQPITGSLSGTVIGINSLESIPGASSAPEVKNGAKFLARRQDATHLRAWLDETPEALRDPLETKLQATVSAAMLTAIRSRGAGLIGWGIVHFFFSNLLEPAWGIAFIVIGLLNLAVPRRVLFIINGLALVAVGFWNGYLSIVGASRLLGLFAAAQVAWGVEEVERFEHYSLANIRRRAKGDRAGK